VGCEEVGAWNAVLIGEYEIVGSSLFKGTVQDGGFSETPVFMSDTALGLSGFAGNHLALDPERGVFEFYLGSRVLNRLSVLVPKPGETIRDYGLNGDGTGAVLWPDGEKVLSSVQYVYLKDEHLHPVTEKLLDNLRRPV
jgi:hypothetical protein